jgi:hypothetical protein
MSDPRELALQYGEMLDDALSAATAALPQGPDRRSAGLHFMSTKSSALAKHRAAAAEGYFDRCRKAIGAYRWTGKGRGEGQPNCRRLKIGRLNMAAAGARDAETRAVALAPVEDRLSTLITAATGLRRHAADGRLNA